MDMPDWALTAGSLVLGPSSLAYWAARMFTDLGAGPWYRDEGVTDPKLAVRAFDTETDPSDYIVGPYGPFSTKNLTSLTAPCGGLLLLGVGLSEVVRLDTTSRYYERIETAVALISLLLGIGLFLGATPVTLPRWMYPQWQAGRRALRRRRQALAAQGVTTPTSQPAPAGTDPAFLPTKEAIPWPPPSWSRKTRRRRRRNQR